MQREVQLPAYDGPRVRVAVATLKSSGVSEHIAYTVTGILRSTLFDTKRFDVLSPEDMEAVLDLKEINTACDDTACWADVGLKLGVRKMVTGSIGKLGATFVITLSLIDVEGVKTEKIVTQECRGEEALTRAIRNAGRILCLP